MNSFEKIEQENKKEITRFEDLRGLDLSDFDLQSSSFQNLETTSFDTNTKWPNYDKLPDDFNPEKVLENGKNSGLGIEKLHTMGINGEGVVVAIIDQKLDIHHPEYSDTIKDYTEYGGAKDEAISMHGPAVASLLVGKNCGVAPKAKLVYMARSSGRDYFLQAQVLNDIIKSNEKVASNEKVKVVSCSTGYSTENPEPGLGEWISVLKKAKEAGLFVVDAVGEQIDIQFTGGGSSENKDDPESYSSWLYQDEKNENLNEIIVPSDHRTMASSYNKEGQYMHDGRGGISWSVPYLAGLFALALQVNPNIKQEEITGIIKESAIINKKGLRIINPEGIIKLVKERATN
jgi:hypothetical protein